MKQEKDMPLKFYFLFYLIVALVVVFILIICSGGCETNAEIKIDSKKTTVVEEPDTLWLHTYTEPNEYVKYIYPAYRIIRVDQQVRTSFFNGTEVVYLIKAVKKEK